MNIQVQRHPADKQGADISDALITSAPCAVARGTLEIDKASTNRELVTLNGPLTQFIRWGSIVEVADRQQLSWRGMVTNTAVSFGQSDSGLAVDITLTVEREHVE